MGGPTICWWLSRPRTKTPWSEWRQWSKDFTVQMFAVAGVLPSLTLTENGMMSMKRRLDACSPDKPRDDRRNTGGKVPDSRGRLFPSSVLGVNPG